MLSFIFRVMAFASIAACCTTAVAADDPPELCETHANAECPHPGSAYRYPMFSCPGARGIKCSVPLPPAVINCEQTAAGDSYCEAWPQAANPALHYTWHSSNPRVTVDGMDSPLQFLGCNVNASTTISVLIQDNSGRSTSSSVFARCKILPAGNPNNHLPL